MTVNVTLRNQKGSALTTAEMDGNFTALKNAIDVLQAGGVVPQLPQISFGTATLSVAEGDAGTTRQVSVTLHRTLTSGPLDVQVTYVPGTADASDFAVAPTSQSFHFNDAQADVTKVLATLQGDAAVEAAETFGFQVPASQSGAYQLGSPSAITITITNDDVSSTPQLSVTGSRTATTAAGQGFEVGRLYGVPGGTTPTVSPNDGRYVLGAKANDGTADYYPIVVGTTARTAGVIAYTFSAAGATAATVNITTTSATAPLRPGRLGMCTINNIGALWLNRMKNVVGFVVENGAVGSDGDGTRGDIDNGFYNASEAVLNADGFFSKIGAGKVIRSGVEFDHFATGTVTRWRMEWTGTAPFSYWEAQRGGAISNRATGANFIEFDWTDDNTGSNAITFRFGASSTTSDTTLLGMTMYPIAQNTSNFVDQRTYVGQRLTNPLADPQHLRWEYYRHLDLQSTNNDVNTDWSLRTKPTSIAWNKYKGAPLEALVEMGVVGQHSSIWLLIPARYTKASWIAMLQWCKANVPATMRLQLEYTNEAWNYNFGQAQYLYAKARTHVLTTTNDLGNSMTEYGYTLAELIPDSWAVFSGADRARLYWHCGIQMGAPSSFTDVEYGVRERGYETGDLFDQVSGTYYIDGGFQGDAVAGTASAQKQKIIDLATLYNTGNASQKQTATNRFIAQVRGVPNNPEGFADGGITFVGHKGHVDYWIALGAQKGWVFGHYEGTLFHFYLNNNWTVAQADDVLVPFFVAMRDSAEVQTLLLEVLRYTGSRTPGTLTIYNQFGYGSRFGDWGTDNTPYTARRVTSNTYQSYQDNPGVSPPAAAAMTSSGAPTQTYIGSSTVFHPAIAGGYGSRRMEVVSNSLPPGRSIKGTTVVGTYATPPAGAVDVTYDYTLRIYAAVSGTYTDLAVHETVSAQAPGFTKWRRVIKSVQGDGQNVNCAEWQMLNNDGSQITTAVVSYAGTSAALDNSLGPDKANDGNLGTFYESADTPTSQNPLYMYREYASAIAPGKVRIVSRDGRPDREGKDHTLEHQNANGTWTASFDAVASGQTAGGQDRTFSLN